MKKVILSFLLLNFTFTYGQYDYHFESIEKKLSSFQKPILTSLNVKKKIVETHIYNNEEKIKKLSKRIIISFDKYSNIIRDEFQSSFLSCYKEFKYDSSNMLLKKTNVIGSSNPRFKTPYLKEESLHRALENVEYGIHIIDFEPKIFDYFYKNNQLIRQKICSDQQCFFLNYKYDNDNIVFFVENIYGGLFFKIQITKNKNLLTRDIYDFKNKLSKKIVTTFKKNTVIQKKIYKNDTLSYIKTNNYDLKNNHISSNVRYINTKKIVNKITLFKYDIRNKLKEIHIKNEKFTKKIVYSYYNNGLLKSSNEYSNGKLNEVDNYKYKFY